MITEEPLTNHCVTASLSAPDCECVHNAKVYGLSDSIRRAKFPMSCDVNSLNDSMTDGIKKIAQSAPGSGHDQWLTGVIVQFDLSFTNKAWVEAERYHFLDFVSSQSTMHRITKFKLGESYCEFVDRRIIEIIKGKVKEYNDICAEIERLNQTWIDDSKEKIKDLQKDQKKKYLEILYSNPAGFVVTAGMTTNYRQLKTIYAQRKNHRLPEWRTFCKWIETLPHSELITGENDVGKETPDNENNNNIG